MGEPETGLRRRLTELHPVPAPDEHGVSYVAPGYTVYQPVASLPEVMRTRSGMGLLRKAVE